MSASSINNNVFLFFYLIILCVLASATQPSTSVENEILARQNKQMAPIEQMFYSSMMRQDSDKTSQIQILKFTFPKMMMKK
jgi:hypothetical protein